MIIRGAISFKSFVDIKSAPELNLGLSCLQTLKISTSEILENSKKFGFLLLRKISKFVSETSISDASFGPIPAKNTLNPFAISRVSFMISPFLWKKLGSWSFCLLDPITSLIRDHVFLLSDVN